MSVIFGIFHKDGKPVTNEPETMYAGMKHFPHEKHAFAVQGGCAFGHMLTYNTPEAVGESMPKWLENERLLFAAEGRIDNRGELFGALDIAPAKQKDTPDGDLMLKAYLKWGADCVDHLAGKWSLAAFHETEKRLFLARDKWDYTNISYYTNDNVFAFASSEKGLLPLPFISGKIDELKIAQLLIGWPGNYHKSYYMGVCRLMPSHCMHITRKAEQQRRYWNYADTPLRRGLKLEAYTDQLLDTLQHAVAARLRSYKPIAATLSGGLDSSTVCMLAAEQLTLSGKRLKTYTHVPLFAPSQTIPARRFGDERPFAQAVADAAGNIDPEYMNSRSISPLEGIQEAVRLCGRPFHGAANAYWLVDIYLTAMKQGYGTLLIGSFGNATTSRKGLIDALPVGTLLRQYGEKAVIRSKLLKPLLYGNHPIARLYKRAAFGKQPWEAISYCTQTFQNSLNVRKRMRESGIDPTYKLYFKNPKAQVEKIIEVNVLRLSNNAEFGHETGLEFRDPTCDPRVIECALAIPNEMYFGEMNKWVLRTMMKGRLPDMVRLNAKKGLQSADIVARLSAHREEMDAALNKMDAAGFGRIIDLDKMRTEWETLKADPGSFPQNAAIHMLRPVAAFELYRVQT